MLNAIRDEYRLRIVDKIAEGGMGAVYKAIQYGATGFNKTVAVKTVLPYFSDTDDIVEMFVQEAKLVADLVHENIVQIYQLGKTDDGYYIVMEFVNGLSLFEFIRYHNLKRMELPPELGVFITSRIARGLAYAHSRKDAFDQSMDIVHRDVCPSNILLTTEGLPKLTDFGIAAVTTHQIQDHKFAGKLRHISPEQACGDKADFRADIFSLGTVLFELLTRAKVREAETDGELLGMAMDGDVDWSRIEGKVDDGLHEILKKCLAKSPDERFQSTAEMARELEYFIYKDGYGPTINTLEQYMRKHFMRLYVVKKKVLSLSPVGA